MSSHREAPRICSRTRSPTTPTPTPSSPPARRSRSSPTTSRPRHPAGGPNFYEFDDDVMYEIHIDNDGDGQPDVTYEFRFETTITNPNTFLYNTGPIDRLDSPNWNRRQTLLGHRGSPADGAARSPSGCRARRATSGRARPPTTRRSPTRRSPTSGRRQGVLRAAGRQLLRRPGLGLRPGDAAPVPVAAPHPHGRRRRRRLAGAVQRAHHRHRRCRSRTSPAGPQVPTDPMDGRRPSGSGAPRTGSGQGLRDRDAATVASVPGPRCRASATRCSTRSSSRCPARTGGTPRARIATRSSPSSWLSPSWPSCSRSSTPGCSPTSQTLTADRADLLAILLTGIPAGLIHGFQNFTGTTQADVLRLNVAIPPSAQPEPPRPARRRPGRLPQRPARSATTWSPSSCGLWPAPPTR